MKTTMLFSATLLVFAAASAGAQPPGAGWLSRETAKQYRELARYPESSRALAAGEADPVVASRASSRVTVRGLEGQGPALAVWSGKVSFEPGQAIELFAALDQPAGRGAAVSGEIVDAAGSILATVEFADDGLAPDRRKEDGLFAARLAAPGDVPPGAAASFLVRVRARLADGELREAAGGFLLSHPGAQLTGRFRDLVRDGSLVVAAEVDVAVPGRFHLAATLATSGGEPVGYAQTGARLEPGRHWLELTYYGLLFHERRAFGRMRLASVSLATTSSMPNALSDLMTGAHVTAPVRRRAVTDRPFGERDLLEAAKRLEVEADRVREEGPPKPQS
jgi:hypothetical protein